MMHAPVSVLRAELVPAMAMQSPAPEPASTSQAEAGPKLKRLRKAGETAPKVQKTGCADMPP